MTLKTRAGYIAIVGRPNVGKSTLLNNILGHKVSITSRKPQTTRKQILGIKTNQNIQSIYVDTPGLHSIQKQAINRYMNRAASAALHDVNVIVFMTEAASWRPDDDLVLEKLRDIKIPILLVMNKVDKIKDKTDLLPLMEKRQTLMPFAGIFAVCARSGTGIEALEKKIISYLPEAPFFYTEDQQTDQTLAFRIAECIREKIIRTCGQELPYATAVAIEELKDDGKLYRIQAVIWVERPGQKAIVIGNNGARLKDIGTQARKDIQDIVGKKVYLNLWVKHKDNWSDSEKLLGQLGFDE